MPASDLLAPAAFAALVLGAGWLAIRLLDDGEASGFVPIVTASSFLFHAWWSKRAVYLSVDGIRGADDEKPIRWSLVLRAARVRPSLGGGISVVATTGVHVPIARRIAESNAFLEAVRALAPADSPLLLTLQSQKAPALR